MFTIPAIPLLIFLVFSNKVIIRGRIFNICKARFSKLVFHVVHSYELPNIILRTCLDTFTVSARFSKFKIT